MKCPICKSGDTKPGVTTVTLERGRATIVYKDVPAEVCDTCGEAFVNAEITQRLLEAAETSVASGVELEVHRYEAA